MKAGSKYYPLYEKLTRVRSERVELSFEEIEGMLGSQLPPSARASKAFWSNRGSGALQAQAWMSAGFHVHQVDLDRKQVTFRRPVFDYEVRMEGDTVLWDGEMVRALRAHLDMSQQELAGKMGVRQQTVSEWERGLYSPTRSRSKHLSLVAERSGFELKYGNEEPA